MRDTMIKRIAFGLSVCALLLVSCAETPRSSGSGRLSSGPQAANCPGAQNGPLTASTSARPPFDLQGHRGARGLAPENTIPAFATALSVGVTTLELDVVLTRDGVPVVTHDDRPNPDVARLGGVYVKSDAPPFRTLDLVDVRRFDVGRAKPGSRYARQFPDQHPSDGAAIPTLREVLAFARNSGVDFNVETKIPDETDIDPRAFAGAIVDAARRDGVLDRLMIQSFDWRTLEEAGRIAPQVALSCLTVEHWWESAEPGGSAWYAGRREKGLTTPELVKAAGCDVWSPYAGDISPTRSAEARALGLRVIPWTVNTERDANRMINAGVDGFITDYPDRMRAFLDRACPEGGV